MNYREAVKTNIDMIYTVCEHFFRMNLGPEDTFDREAMEHQTDLILNMSAVGGKELNVSKLSGAMRRQFPNVDKKQMNKALKVLPSLTGHYSPDEVGKMLRNVKEMPVGLVTGTKTKASLVSLLSTEGINAGSVQSYAGNVAKLMKGVSNGETDLLAEKTVQSAVSRVALHGTGKGAASGFTKNMADILDKVSFKEDEKAKVLMFLQSVSRKKKSPQVDRACEFVQTLSSKAGGFKSNQISALFEQASTALSSAKAYGNMMTIINSSYAPPVPEKKAEPKKPDVKKNEPAKKPAAPKAPADDLDFDFDPGMFDDAYSPDRGKGSSTLGKSTPKPQSAKPKTPSAGKSYGRK